MRSFLIVAIAVAFSKTVTAQHFSGPIRQENITETKGEYLGHKWQIDEDHLMWFDGKPYVPFGGFGIEPDNPFELHTYNLWIDFDPFIGRPNYTRQQHKRDIAGRLKRIAESGGTCIVQFSMALPHVPDGPKPDMQWQEPEGGIDGSRLSDPKVKQAISKVWAEYAPAVRNECVRAIVLWNEINVWRWPERMSVDDYAEVLGEYVRETKRLVGDVPVCFKIAGTWNAEAVVAGAAVADGLGFDVWFNSPNDVHARREIERALRMLEGRQKKTTWFFIAEGGRGIAEGGTDDTKGVEDYWDNWPPLRSKTEARGILRAYAQAGAKGFIYNGPTSDPGSKYRNSYRWLGELKSEITRLTVGTKRTARRAVGEPPGIATAADAIAAARADRMVQELLRGVDSPRVTAEFSQRWRVWLVHFFAGDRPLGFASVSREGEVLEVGGPEEGEREGDERRPDDDVHERTTRSRAVRRQGPSADD